MRFSSLFQPIPPASGQAQEKPLPDSGQATAMPPHELPDELDARVRLIGEWQLGEG